MSRRTFSSVTLCECGDHAFQPLTRGFVTLVSPEDAHLLAVCWVVNIVRRLARAQRLVLIDGKYHSTFLSSKICPHEEGKVTDHRNRDALDNRRQNLRPATTSQNNANRRLTRKRDLPRGVFRRKGRFEAAISIDNRKRYLGLYGTALEAHRAYCEAAVTHYGEFARFE